MVIVEHHLNPAALPKFSQSISVLSYNVLLPNSVDAWWTYKMYCPPLDAENQHVASWDYRRKLLKDRLNVMDADVVCFQEVSPTSFEDDFAFMKHDLGYDGVELFRKGRFRPATFWKTNRCELLTPPAHKDRTLLTAFRTVSLENGDDGKNRKETDNNCWFILNCHLQAGKEGKRRVRQIVEGTKAIMTMAKKLKVKDPADNARAIVCGDFNGGPECGAVRLLEDGEVGPDFEEDTEPVTSSKKTLSFSSPLVDVMSSETNKIGRVPPASMVVPELISIMVAPDSKGAYADPKLSTDVIQRLERIYKTFATKEIVNEDGETSKVMSTQDVERWLVQINGRLCRGDEYREAARQMGWTAPPEAKDLPHDELKVLIKLPQDSTLSIEGFIHVYQREMQRGKFWGVAHDLAVLGEALPKIGLFQARFDRMYCSSVVQPCALVDTISTKACPNESEPSDHLPIAATFVPK